MWGCAHANAECAQATRDDRSAPAPRPENCDCAHNSKFAVEDDVLQLMSATMVVLRDPFKGGGARRYSEIEIVVIINDPCMGAAPWLTRCSCGWRDKQICGHPERKPTDPAKYFKASRRDPSVRAGRALFTRHDEAKFYASTKADTGYKPLFYLRIRRKSARIF
jgi:hypothetical protein